MLLLTLAAPAAAYCYAHAFVISGEEGVRDAVVELSVDTTGCSEPLAVSAETLSDEAIEGQDFTGYVFSQVFDPGQTVELRSTIAVLDDQEGEGPERARVQVEFWRPGQPQPGVNNTPLVIYDDEPYLIPYPGEGCASWEIATDCPIVAYDEHGQPLIHEGDSGVVGMRFNVTLSHVASQEVRVDYGTLDRVATAGSDYAATRGTLVFPPGSMIQTVVVPVYGDTVIEGDEQLSLYLANATGPAWIGDYQTQGEIAEDDVWYVAGSASGGGLFFP